MEKFWRDFIIEDMKRRDLLTDRECVVQESDCRQNGGRALETKLPIEPKGSVLYDKRH